MCSYVLSKNFIPVFVLLLLICLTNAAVTDPTCVTDNAQLRRAILNAETNPKNPRTRITLCKETILISNAVDPVTGTTGINLSNRFIDLRCNISSSSTEICRLDGKYKSRIFFGTNVNLNVTGVAFLSAEPQDDGMDGGAFSFRNHSVITLNFPCNMVSNKSPLSGGAIYLKDSILTINGGVSDNFQEMYFSGNSASKSGGAFAVINSKIVIRNSVTFFLNSAADSGAIALYNTSGSFKGVLFDANKAIPGSNGALNVERSTVSMEDIDFTQNNAFTWSSALQITQSSVTLKNVSFRRNNSTEGGTMAVVKSNVTITKGEFFENTADLPSGALFVRFSKVTLNDTIFTRNEDGLGSNLYVDDNNEPKKGGSFVRCGAKTLFCEGLGKFSIYDTGNIANTDCKTKGVVGKPGINC